MRSASLLLLAFVFTTPVYADKLQAVGCKSQESAVAFAREYTAGKTIDAAIEALPLEPDKTRPCMYQQFEIAGLTQTAMQVPLRSKRVHIKKGTVSGVWGELHKKPVLMEFREHTRFIVELT